jgi:hypothetical protein
MQGCKVLLVAEAKAFFSLLPTLSSAGYPAVQLDKNKQLPVDSPDTNLSEAAATAQVWEAAVSTALAVGKCLLVTHEQLYNAAMPCTSFDFLIEYIARQDTAFHAFACSNGSNGNLCEQPHTRSTAAAAPPPPSPPPPLHVLDTRQQAVARHFIGRHFVINSVKPDLAAVAAAAATASVCHQGQRSSSSDVQRRAAAEAGAVRLAASTVNNSETFVAPSTSAAAQQEATHSMNPVPVAAGTTTATHELPLVLHRGRGSIFRRRRDLYEALLRHLEGQGGFLLVERLLQGSAAGVSTSSTDIAGSIDSDAAAVVDVVLSPAACLCVFDEWKLPQVSCCPGTFLRLLLWQLEPPSKPVCS